MNKQKGITLIALIITIIVMLILVGVTINIAVQGGLFEKAKKSVFQMEVRQIQEALVIAKTVVIAENNGDTPTTFNINWNNLDIATETQKKYQEKLTIQKGELYYIEEKITAKEEKWLKELGIKKYAGESTLFQTVVDIAKQGDNTSEYNVYDYIDIIKQTLQEKPETIVLGTYALKSSKLDYPILSGMIGDEKASFTFNDLASTQETLEIYTRCYKLLNISNKYNITYENIVKFISGDNSIENSEAQAEIEVVLEEYEPVEGWAILLDAFFPGMNYVLIDNEKTVLVGYKHIVDLTDTKQIMSQNEFNNTFEYDTVDGNIMITGYKGTSSNLKVPAYVYDESGNLSCVEKIAGNAFFTATEINFTEMINGESNLADVANILTKCNDDYTTLENVSTLAYVCIQNIGGFSYNPFNKYINDGIDGSDISDNQKYKYVSLPIYKLALQMFLGIEVTDENMESILESIDNRYFIKDENNNINIYINISTGELFEPADVTNITEVTIHLDSTLDNCYIGYDNSSPYYGRPIFDNSVQKLTIVNPPMNGIIGSEVFDNNSNLNVTVIAGRDEFRDEKIYGAWRNDVGSVTWAKYDIDI